MRNTVRTAARVEHEILGQVLKDLREQAGFSQRDLAKHLDRTQAFVWKVETGYQHLDIATLIDYAKLFETTASEIVKAVEAKASKISSTSS